MLSVRVRDSSQRMRAHAVLINSFNGQVELKSDPRALTVRTEHQNTVIEAYENLQENVIQGFEFSLGQQSLDEVFLAMTDHAD